MIDEHGINRKYTQHFSFPPDKWERIFGLREELKAQEEEAVDYKEGARIAVEYSKLFFEKVTRVLSGEEERFTR